MLIIEATFWGWRNLQVISRICSDACCPVYGRRWLCGSVRSLILVILPLQAYRGAHFLSASVAIWSKEPLSVIRLKLCIRKGDVCQKYCLPRKDEGCVRRKGTSFIFVETWSLWIIWLPLSVQWLWFHLTWSEWWGCRCRVDVTLLWNSREVSAISFSIFSPSPRVEMSCEVWNCRVNQLKYDSDGLAASHAFTVRFINFGYDVASSDQLEKYISARIRWLRRLCGVHC